MATYSNNIKIKSSGRHTHASTTNDLVTVGTNEYAEITLVHQYTADHDNDQDTANSIGGAPQHTIVHNFTAGATTVFGMYSTTVNNTTSLTFQYGTVNFSLGTAGSHQTTMTYVIKENA